MGYIKESDTSKKIFFSNEFNNNYSVGNNGSSNDPNSGGKLHFSGDLLKKNISNSKDTGSDLKKNLNIFNRDFDGFVDGNSRKITKFVKKSRPRIRIGNQPPEFNRSPHVRTAIKPIELMLPQKDRVGEKPEYNWVTSLLPQMLMLIVMVVVFFLSGFGSLIFTVPMYLVTIFTGILSYNAQKKKYKKKIENSDDNFRTALHQLERIINNNKRDQVNVLKSEYPSMKDCDTIVEQHLNWMWRVSPDEEMFLDTRLGIGDVPSMVDLKVPYNNEVDADIINSSKIVQNVPVSIPIRRYNIIGMTGKRKENLNQIRSMIISAAVNHSYDELKIAVFYPIDEAKEWVWTRWLPHVWDDDRQNRYLASSSDERVTLCKVLEEIISKRTSSVSASKSDKTHYLVIVSDQSVVAHQNIMKYLTSDRADLGISTVFMENDRANLPSGCKAIIEVNASNSNWYPTIDVSEKHRYSRDNISVEQCDRIARNMAPIRVAVNKGALKLPRSVTFLEGYNVRTVNELKISDKWKKSNYGKSLSVPIGVKKNGEPFYFDINRKKDGPHGMVAGGTGSGKSDIVQSWILSMALHFKPTEVSFIIVDYKGDGLLAPFRKLPHLVGTISNLDNKVERNVTALNSELDRRQLLFKECGAHNIEDYIEKYQHGEIDTALPYLIIVIDEFADFKANHPEFMPIVNAIYTKGASLGVYCIVLAQDAASAVNSTTIPVNSRFRWCMKVDSDDASTGMLGTHDAYTMTKLPGRGYVKIGNFEVYEKIQAFWSGAYYHPDKDNDMEDIPPVSKISINGTRIPVSDTSLSHDKDIGIWTSVKEIDVIVDYIAGYVNKNSIEIPKQIWQPPMPKSVVLDDIIETGYMAGTWINDTPMVDVTFGMVDDPVAQIQYTLSYKLNDSGNISIQGGPESGKTTALLTAAMSLVERFSPENLHIYLFDFDKWTLNLLVNLPHVKGSTAAAEPEDVKNIIKSIREELNRRKVLFMKKGAISIEGYHDMGEKIPAIILFIDNIVAAWDDSMELQEMLYEVAQKGAGYGIYMLATSPGTTFPYKLSNFFKTKFTLRQNDRGDYNSIVGRSELTPEEYPGRGLAKLRYPVEIQIALPAPGSGEAEINRNIHNIVEDMCQNIVINDVGNKSDNVDWHNLDSYGDVVFGIDERMLEPVKFSESGKHTLIISAVKQDALKDVTGKFIEQIEEIENAELVIFDDKNGDLDKEICTKYFAADDSGMNSYISSLMEVMDKRASVSPDSEELKKPIYLFIADWRDFFEFVENETIIYLNDIVEMGQGLSVYLIIAGLNAGISYLASSGERLTNRVLKQRHAILIGESLSEHKLFQTSLSSSEENSKMPDGSAYYINDKSTKKIKLI